MYQLIGGSKGHLFQGDKVPDFPDNRGKFYKKIENALTSLYNKVNKYNDLKRISSFSEDHYLKKVSKSVCDMCDAHMLYMSNDIWYGIFEVKFEDK